MRRPIVLAAILFVLISAAPAYAQTAPNASVTAPGDGQIVEGAVTVRAKGSAATGVRSIKLFIEGTQVASKEPGELRQEVDIDYAWNTAAVISGSGIARNGWYQVKVVVAANGGGSKEATRNVRVNNGATTPAGLSVVTDDRSVSLSWAANPEPDIQAYRIEADSGSGFAAVGESTTTSFDYQVDYGTYTWRVVALRSSPADAGGRASAPSESVSATVKAPATAKSSGGSSGGGHAVVGKKKIYGGAATSKEAAKVLNQTARRFASGGVSSAAISLPGAAVGLPSLPDTELEWGTYEEKLPYNLPAKDVGEIESIPTRLAAQSTSVVMPPDGLRWVAAGLLLLVTAALLQFLALRAEKKAQTA